mmetsp:Transcript_36461/g.44123  ORF Transcript_36461/g.44123 Transcript_36461/m.44123 type:complete len:300 (-) Transcript_36461:94-993(-)|eukprot:CAMPEP_0197857440 /NCGR_PEP_ID=MMETSP1438-20131217/30511_1 /TAXON_ID=1461541 /ORGANISM="Pterosperma sp., Strain CCMP1384" /LENGTH=299 /DNA_ID=CAMNT_0043473271 /DNA_START=119 /DNA_END=1018 /DNA_ORIENTATION=-
MNTTLTMVSIFTTMFAVLGVASMSLTPVKTSQKIGLFSTNPSKASGEIFSLVCSAAWILAVVVVIALQLFEAWGPWEYMTFCVTCAVPYVLYPLIKPFQSDMFPYNRYHAAVPVPLSERYITKANVWIAIFSFIGNYWYTHYFYHVLKADYSFPAHRLNDVPICLYFMTHAYFMFYHVLSNVAIRAVRTRYMPGTNRFVFECIMISVMSYSTAFMESLTICGFPYYRFEDRHMAYTVGSAFYSIYFLASFPMFLRVDEDQNRKFTLFQTINEALASSMLVLCILDFVRLYLNVPLFRDH